MTPQVQAADHPTRARPPRPGSWSLGQRVSVLAVLVAMVLGLIAAGITVAAMTNRSTTRYVMNKVTPALINNERLYLGLLRQQTSMRTYLLTGREDDLRSYQESVATERDLLAVNRRLLDGHPDLLAGLDRAEQALAGYRATIAEPLIAATRASGPDPARAAPDERARTVYLTAANEINALGVALTAERQRESRRALGSGGRLTDLLLGAAAIVVTAGVALAFLLRRAVIAPVAGLAVEVRRVAGGDYEHRIAGTGVPELSSLARDVDAMRRRIASDLSEVTMVRRQLESVNAQLEEQAEELTRSNRDLEQFAYVASHDLQEPLRKVASFCQLLQRRYAGQLDERADQYIEFAVDGAQRMQRLINDLLAFSRIGRITTGFTEVDLELVVKDAIEQLDAERERTGAEIVWTGLPRIRGEEPLLLALVANLIGNSLKFRRPDAPPRVEITGRLVDGAWEISCQDNGIGIAPEFTEKVFIIFQRLHAKAAYPGTGIGLAIAKKIVEYHGGQIWVDPEYSAGTRIRFTLPALPERTTTTDGPAADGSDPVPAAELATDPAPTAGAGPARPASSPNEESTQ